MPSGAGRLDRELVSRGLARSRGHARELLDAGHVVVDGEPATKPAAPVAPSAAIEVTDPGARWVGRAAGKLDAALRELGADGPRIPGARCIDLGACTGGFTQVLLERGAEHVVALDVGHDQLAPSLATDPRVTDRSGLTLRGLRPEEVDGPFAVVVSDLSFISVRLVLDEIRDLLTEDGEAVLLVKPQFEVGRDGLGRRGVVTDPRRRRQAVHDVLDAVEARDLGARRVLASAVPGGEGNREYLVHVTRRPAERATWQALRDSVDALIEEEAP